MYGEHNYELALRWDGNRGTGTSGYRDYGRDVRVSVAGKPDLEGSADRPFRGDPQKWNPEDLLLAALAQCHLLSYLHVAVTAGVVVTDYRDVATALMREDGAGGGNFIEAVLHPVVTIERESMREAALAAHQRANELCFIARSVNFPVRHEPEIRVRG
ncbi:OsmC family protein [Mycetocola spongiae]|uniref:OsmC family protein n=1 Tax=Mycetocola spongiae TaxID=2859226 RepID=UPI001CF31F58|nr:OsmC family protein [Mycetocola spongiae]UCR90127.1 OsmC family protein [Mycetocola spongiae]